MVNKQTEIGWNLLLRGFLAQQWQDDQRKYVHMKMPALMKSKAERRKQEHRSTYVLSFIWSEVHEYWKTRCDYVHRKTEQHVSTQDQLRAQVAVRALYSYSDEIGYFDRKIFDRPLEERLLDSPRDQFAWVSSMQPAVMAARKEHFFRSTEKTPDIREYFAQLEPRYADRRNLPAPTQSQSSTTRIQDNPS